MTDPKHMLSSGLFAYDDLKIGDHYQTGRIKITETHIVNFAGLSGDFFDLHMDDEFAQDAGFPSRVAHGLLGLILVDGLKNRAPVQLAAIASLGWSDWKFHGPLFAGDTVHAVIEVVHKRLTRQANRGIVSLQFRVFRNKTDVVQSGQTQLLMSLNI